MGAYLSTPKREKDSFDYKNERFSYGASSMQGWRVSQEDAHNCCPDFDSSVSSSLFAVYDGHGGAEVAEYTAKHFPSFLREVESYKKGQVSQALEDAFLAFDKRLTEDKVIAELRELAGTGDDEANEADQEEEVAGLFEEAEMPMEKLMERYGAKNKSFEQLREKGDSFQSPALRAKKKGEEETGSGDGDDNIKVNIWKKMTNGASKNEVSGAGDGNAEVKNRAQLVNGDVSSGCADSKSNDTSSSGDAPTSSSSSGEAKPTKTTTTTSEANEATTENGSTSEDAAAKTDTQNSSTTSAKTSPSKQKEQEETKAVAEEVTSSSSSAAAATGSAPSSGSAAAENEAVAIGSVSSTCGSSGSTSANDEPSSSSGRRRSGKKSAIPAEGEDETSEEEETDTDEENSDSEFEEMMMEGDDDDDDDDDSEDEDEAISNFAFGSGDEPGSESGCTAVVAVMRERELFVANAGDSRCVVCRAGKAIDMSVDHKPEDELERTRIEKAGGKVTEDNRVNGGLNLSRAIGDHVYKRNAELDLKDQMITPLPDVKSLTLTEEDEFMVLACDGIWNVMTSQDVCTFVADRLRAGQHKSLSHIVEEMFDFCLAPDTSGDGTGCDNMTCIIVQFHDQSKSSTADSTSGVKRPLASTDVDDSNTADAKKAKDGESS